MYDDLFIFYQKHILK